MKKSLKYKIVLAIVIIVCIMDVSFIFVNYVNYMNVNRNYTDSLAQTVANTCRLVVDGDSVTGYLDNRRRNTAYYEVWNKLIDYCNTSENVLQISVVNFRDGGGCYVYDTDLTENGAFLGDIRPYDEVQNAVKDEKMLVVYAYVHSHFKTLIAFSSFVVNRCVNFFEIK